MIVGAGQARNSLAALICVALVYSTTSGKMSLLEFTCVHEPKKLIVIRAMIANFTIADSCIDIGVYGSGRLPVVYCFPAIHVKKGEEEGRYPDQDAVSYDPEHLYPLQAKLAHPEAAIPYPIATFLHAFSFAAVEKRSGFLVIEDRFAGLIGPSSIEIANYF